MRKCAMASMIVLTPQTNSFATLNVTRIRSSSAIVLPIAFSNVGSVTATETAPTVVTRKTVPSPLVHKVNFLVRILNCPALIPNGFAMVKTTAKTDLMSQQISVNPAHVNPIGKILDFFIFL